MTMARENRIEGRREKADRGLSGQPGPSLLKLTTDDDGAVRATIYASRYDLYGVPREYMRLGSIALTPETARAMATSLNEHAQFIEEREKANEPAVYRVVVEVPATRAKAAGHAKNLVARALSDYHGSNGPANSEVVEVKTVTHGEIAAKD
jgi:hypothetical protein